MDYRLAADAPARQRERRILARGDDQVQLGRQMFDQKGERLVQCWGFDSNPTEGEFGVIVLQE